MATSKTGYDPRFLGVRLSFPKLPKSLLAPLDEGNGNEIKYIHYSAFVHRNRTLPFMTAVNIKGELYNAPVREEGKEPWDYSDQVVEECQLDNAFYGNDRNTFDRGHLVRRVDSCWGSDELAAAAELDTFKWINCTPQHKKLNQKGGVWYQLEQHVMEHGVKNKIADISVFAGPVLKNTDNAFVPVKGKYKGRHIQIPIEFWKVIVWKKSNGKLYAVAFLMSQWEFIKQAVVPMPAVALKAARAPKKKLEDDYFENLKFKDHKTYQVPVKTIEEKTGIVFNWGEKVIFPYKAKKAQVVKGYPLKNKYSFASLVKKSGNKNAGKNIARSPSKPAAPLSETQVKKAVKNGDAGAIKRFSLKNITL